MIYHTSPHAEGIFGYTHVTWYTYLTNVLINNEIMTFGHLIFGYTSQLRNDRPLPFSFKDLLHWTRCSRFAYLLAPLYH